jgi:hypothetical protein
LHQIFEALAKRLTEVQAEEELVLVLEEIRAIPPTTTTNVVLPHALQGLALAFQALAPKLTDAQTQQALALLLERIDETTDTFELSALAQEYQALAPKLNQAQDEQALAALLRLIDKTSPTWIAQPIGVMAPRLAQAQVEKMLIVMLGKVGETTDSGALQALAQTIRVLAPKVSITLAKQAFIVAKSSLAWSATDKEAAEWARTLVASLPHARDGEGGRELLEALVYPTAVGPATEVLLEAIRAIHSDAPTEAGTAAIFAWLAEKYPVEARRPICPPPLQPTLLSGLKCPP